MSGVSLTKKMRLAGCSEAQIERFLKKRNLFLTGPEAYISESDIRPVPELPKLDELPASTRVDWSRLAVLKLNGGLGTSMGLSIPKSLVEVKKGKTFLDFIVMQSRALGISLLLMNSFHTEPPTLKYLKKLEFQQDLPCCLCQSRVPKLDLSGEPAYAPERPELEWCPPGHGDIYPTLIESGIRDALLKEGIEILFVSNADNLSAIPKAEIMEWFIQEQAHFAMEVTRRTPIDQKGGHLALSKDGRFCLREIAQCPEEDIPAFMDIEKHRIFNTNNLWIRLDAVDHTWYDLPLIVNRKTLDPTDPKSPPVVQLETAMGAVIGLLKEARAIEVPRSRFAPVKTTSDLMIARSDVYETDANGCWKACSEPLPRVTLDPQYYKRLQDYDDMVRVTPSLMSCRSLEVVGPVVFDEFLELTGEVLLSNKGSRRIPARLLF